MQNLLLWSALLLGSFVLIAVIVKFPLPRPTGGFAAGELLRDRASDISEGAAASSRWALLPELMAEIKEAPLLGQGFGAAVTYITDDPRIREQNPSGRYTTYAFEWGLLDIWLKLGLLGLLVYLSLLACLFWPGFTSDSPLLSGLSLGLAAIIATSIFSPYLNHPLGIGYIIIYIAVLNNNSTRHLI